MANGGALYSITTRASGTTLTAVIYNADHQNHVNNGDATQLGAYSVSLAQMQSTTDPGLTGAEVLAAAISDELLRLRFVLSLLGGGTQWYNPLELTNKTGGALAVGDVVTLDTTASSVALSDTAASLAPLLISLDAPTNTSKGRFKSVGMVQKINVSNATTIGHYLTKSATTKQAQDSGTALGATTVPPAGAFAVALSSTAGAGNVIALLLGSTNPLAQSVTTTATPQFSSLGLGVAAGAAGTLSMTGKLVRYNNAVPADGQLLIGNTAGATWDVATLTAGTGVTVTNAGGSVTLAIGQAVATTSTPQFSSVGLGVAAGAAGTLKMTGKLILYNNVAPTDGQVLIGDTVGAVWTAATLTAGANITLTNAAGAITIAATGGSFANPTASIGLTAVNGVATTSMRSDAAPALSQSIAPTWTGNHLFNGTNNAFGLNATTLASSIVVIGSRSTTVADLSAVEGIGLNMGPSFKLSGGNQTNFICVQVIPNVLADGTPRTVTNVYGGYFADGNKGANVTITNAYGIYTTVPTLGGTLNSAFTSSGKIHFKSLTGATGTPNSVCLDATSKEVYENAATSCLVSSLRYKENIKNLSERDALRIVMGLRPATYNMRGAPVSDRRFGLPAEWVAEIEPGLVDWGPDGQPHATRYQEMVATLAKVIQKQQRDITMIKHLLLSE